MVEIDRAGAALAEARARGQRLENLPGGLPVDQASAYAIQRAASAARGMATCGWKIGATSPETQRLLGADQPMAAPLFEAERQADGAVIKIPGFGRFGIEPEFAVRLGADLPARTEPYTTAEVTAAVASVHPAFELIGLRLPDDVLQNVLAVIADFGANTGFIAGAGVTDWHDMDLAAIEVTVAIDGQEAARGSGANVLGHPLNSLLWLADAQAEIGAQLRAGEWVSTGTCAGLLSVSSGNVVAADFGVLGTLGVQFVG